MFPTPPQRLFLSFKIRPTESNSLFLFLSVANVLADSGNDQYIGYRFTIYNASARLSTAVGAILQGVSRLDLDTFADGGEMGERMRSHAWSQTPLGAVETWPQSLQAALRMMLRSRQPMLLWWGPSLIQFYNDASISLLGQRHPAALGRSAEAVWADIWPWVGPQAKAVLARGEMARSEGLALSAEGSDSLRTTCFDLSYSPIADERGEVGGILCACAERSQRCGAVADSVEWREIEEILQASENRFRQMAETIQDVFWVTDFRIPQILYVSPAYQQIWGRSADEIYRDHGLWLKTVHPDDRDLVLEVLAQCQHQDYVENEYRIVRPDGAVRWIHDRSFAVRDHQGEIIQAVGTAQDITDRKQIEAEREQLLAQAETAREQAETANRVKDEFLAMLSHELRSPLNPILGWSKLLQSRSFGPEKTQQALATIERNARLQAQLIEDLLDISRILRGKLSLKVVPVNLEQTVVAALETVQLSAEAKSIQVETVFASDVPFVLGDRNRLQQVIWNLLSNAIKFTPAGGAVVVWLKRNNNQVCFSISDTGRGISPDFIPYLFESFRQADAGTTRKYGGLGLGLAIVRQLVELHGGTVRAESPGEEQGAIFTVCLPTMPTNLVRELPEPPLPVQAADLEGVHVLVVEDEADARNVLIFILEQAGAAVTGAGSAAEGLALLYETKPDLLISDIAMPKADGYGLIQQVRSLAAGISEVPAIALTAYVTETDRQQILAAGFQQHLAKPIDPVALVEAAKALVEDAL